MYVYCEIQLSLNNTWSYCFIRIFTKRKYYKTIRFNVFWKRWHNPVVFIFIFFTRRTSCTCQQWLTASKIAFPNSVPLHFESRIHVNHSSTSNTMRWDCKKSICQWDTSNIHRFIVQMYRERLTKSVLTIFFVFIFILFFHTTVFIIIQYWAHTIINHSSVGWENLH